MGVARSTRWVAVMLAFALSAQAEGLLQGKVRNLHKRDLRAEVEAVDRRWGAAEASNDVDSMDKLLAEDYLGISGTGQGLTKAQQLDRMRTRKTAMAVSDLQDVKVKLLGKTAAIVTSQATLEGTFDSRAVHGRFRSTRVYKRLGGVWQLTSFEATPEREHEHDRPHTE